MERPLACEVVTLEQVYSLAWRLGELVAASGFQPQLVVAVARGGFVPARLLCDFLGIGEMASLQVRHYAAAGQAEREARVSRPVGGEVGGRRVLLVDDVNDTGETLAVAGEYLRGLDVEALRVAVLHEKATSRMRADFVAGALSRWRWIVYPWALVEDVGGFLRRLQPAPSDLRAAAASLEAVYGLRMPLDQLSPIAEKVLGLKP